MPSLPMRCMLFLSSYFPLSLIIFVLFVAQDPLLAWIILSIGLLGLVCMLLFFFAIVPRIEGEKGTITSRHVHGSEVMGYIASYVVPFVTFQLNQWQQTAALLIFLLMLGVIYVNSEDMLRINPMLNLIGFHLYEITLNHGKESYALITRRRIKHNDSAKLTRIGDELYICLERKA